MSVLFDASEILLIKECLADRKETNSGKDECGYKDQVRRIDFLVSKLDYNWEISRSDKSLICGCLNDISSKVFGDYNHIVFDKNPYSFTTKLIENPGLAKLKDQIVTILTKCGYFKNPDYKVSRSGPFLTYNIQRTIAALKDSDHILMSDPKKGVYKIAFVIGKKQAIKFEVKNQISLYNTSAETITDDYPRFLYKCNRKDALRIIKNCDRQYYPIGNIEFLEHILT